LWMVASAGGEVSWGRLRIVPEVGGILQASNVEEPLLIGGITLWRGKTRD
jgi:hypothetical protein